MKLLIYTSIVLGLVWQLRTGIDENQLPKDVPASKFDLAGTNFSNKVILNSNFAVNSDVIPVGRVAKENPRQTRQKTKQKANKTRNWKIDKKKLLLLLAILQNRRVAGDAGI